MRDEKKRQRPTIIRAADLPALIANFERTEYERICSDFPVCTDESSAEYKRHPERHPGNHPSDYEELSDAKKQALRYWIDHAITASKRYETRTSYGIKHDFENEGFYITNGQFKGAMLLAGYTPKDVNALNWQFPIRQRVRAMGALSEDYQLREHYTLGCFDKSYARLLSEAVPYFKGGE